MFSDRARSQLIVVDVQERLVPTIHEAKPMMDSIARLIRYASILDVPVTFTELMPQRIGATLAPLLEAGPPSSVCLSKSTFSSWREPVLRVRISGLRQQRRDQVILCGMEAHVCVMQTALDLLSAGFEVLVVADAVGSRNLADYSRAIDRLSKAGAAVVTQEMIAFEWLERGDAPEFKHILSVLK